MKKLILLGIICILILSGCEYVEIAKEKVTKTTSKECEEKASKLIPDNMTLSHTDKISIFYWKDGSPAGRYPLDIIFTKGKEAGENINYYYTRKDVASTRDYLIYKKQVVDEEGNIKGYNEFAVKFVLKQIGSSREFEVVDYEIVACEWVE